MKKKLTLTVDAELLPKIKKIALIKKTSVSVLFEEEMRDLLNEGKQTFAKKWRGKLQNKAQKGHRYDYLSKKYL